MTASLVIGSEGFLGKALCRFLEMQGERIVPYDIKRTENEDARRSQLPLADVDRAYVLAWEVGGAKYLYRHDTQVLQMHWNVRLLLNVMSQLEDCRIPFVFVSSQLAEVVDSVYGVTKRLGEVWAGLIGGVSLRCWNIYGPLEPATERSHVVSDFVWQAVQAREIRLLTSGEEQRQFIHADDVARAFRHSLDQKLTGVFDVSSFEWVRVIDVASIIAELTGARVIPGASRGSSQLTANRGKMPGWAPTVGLREGLARMVKEALEQAAEPLPGRSRVA